MMLNNFYLNLLYLLLINVMFLKCDNEFCNLDGKGTSECSIKTQKHDKYTKEANEYSQVLLETIDNAVAKYEPCQQKNCSCHLSVIKQDLLIFKNGISKKMIEDARKKGTKYQIIDHHLYRDADCMFPARCSGIEHFILPLLPKLPDMEMIVNTRDWPQVNRHFGELLPVFSFSKTSEYADIMYPTWGFWEGGPAIKLYPRGLGRWDLLRKSLAAQAVRWPWQDKSALAFFRGSRTSDERDALVLLSRARPDLVDAQFTKNQAWKSDQDTLHAPPAEEVSLEDHCRHRYLFNFRGVAASFRLKHLFLCRSLVFHVGDEWLEFFYPAMVPWVHYVPVRSKATQEDIRLLLEFFSAHDDVAQAIASRGYDYVWDHVRMQDVTCYWRRLLLRYAKLLDYQPERDHSLVEVTR